MSSPTSTVQAAVCTEFMDF